jgi:hypothetical protein
MGVSVGVVVVAVLAALAAGFMVGLLTRRRGLQFCDHHGVTMTCPICTTASADSTPQRRAA